MSDHRLPFRLAAVVLACHAVGACSMLRHDSIPANPAPPTIAPPSGAVSASTPAAAAVPFPAMAEPQTWTPAAPRHLDAAAMVGQTWTFPSADPPRYGDIRFTFRRGGVEASNAREHLAGTWTVERDKLCVTLNSSAWGTACYYVTGASPGELRIRALPGDDLLPLKIQ